MYTLHPSSYVAGKQSHVLNLSHPPSPPWTYLSFKWHVGHPKWDTQRMTIDSQIGDVVPAFDTTSEVQEYVQLQFWCCGHRDCARVLVVGRDGCVNEQLLRVAETHVQKLHGQNALERDDE